MAKKLSAMEQRSSSKVLGDLRSEAQKMMKGKMDKLKKVTVASDSKKGLKKGLDVAEKIIGGDSEDVSAVDKELCPVCGDSSCSCEEPNDIEDNEENKDPYGPTDEAYSETDGNTTNLEDMSDDEIDQRLKELLAHKAKKSHKSNY